MVNTVPWMILTLIELPFFIPTGITGPGVFGFPVDVMDNTLPYWVHHLNMVSPQLSNIT